jgi:hypothetical protein
MEDISESKRDFGEDTSANCTKRAPEQNIPVDIEEGSATRGVYFKPR